MQDAPHLYVTAAIALVFKAIVIPVALHRIIVRLGIHREIEKVVGVGTAMLLGMGLVALSMVVMLRVTAEADPLAREDSSLDIGQRLLHGRPGLVAHNLWPTRQIAVFGGVRNRITHPCQAPFVNQIHDQLHFVDAFEICDLRLIAGFN